MRRLLRWVFIAGGLGGLGWLIARVLRSSEAPSPEPAPVVAPVTPAAPAPEPEPESAPAPAAEAWVRPDGEACPATHPIKAKESSHIYHVPGGLSYERTVADRCYASEDAAEADGYRKAKR